MASLCPLFKLELPPEFCAEPGHSTAVLADPGLKMKAAIQKKKKICCENKIRPSFSLWAREF